MYNDEQMVAYDYGPSFSSILMTLAAVALLGLGIVLAVLLVRLLLVATRALTVFSRERELHLEVMLAERGPGAPAAPPAPAEPAPPSADGDDPDATPR
jgi:hypothetical protein